jgi:hypothetical protein
MQDSQALRKQIRNSVYLQEEKAVRELASEQYLSNIQKKSLIQNKNILNIMMDDRLKISSYIREEFAKRKYGILNVINPLDSSQEVTTDWLLGLVLERTKTENLVASGGNTQLFNLSDDSNVIAV